MALLIGRPWSLTALWIGCVWSLSLSAQTTTLTFQSATGTGITNTLTRSSSMRPASTLSSSFLWTTENTDLSAKDAQAYPILDFPNIIGTGSGKVPPGAQIVSAKLKLWCKAVNGAMSNIRVLTAYPVMDADRLGTWYEPQAPVFQGLQVGVNWLRRDWRSGVERPWDLTVPIDPTMADSPTMGSMYPGIYSSVTVDVTANPAVGTYQAGEFHVWNVTFIVWTWAQGLSNQGWIIKSNSGSEVVYASDDDGVASHRPVLEVIYQTNTVGTPYNYIPVIGSTVPATPTTPVGENIAITLTAVDQDGTVPDWLIIEQPTHGELLGIAPFLTYRPFPGYVGNDSFRYIARDFLSSSNPATCNIVVAASAGAVTTTLQKGLLPTPSSTVSATRSSGVNYSVSAGGQVTFEDQVFKVSAKTSLGSGRQAYLDFPNLVGTAAGRIPPGSKILAARLEMKTQSISAPGTDTRVVSLHRVVDPLDRATTWFEPPADALEPNGAVNVGVSNLHLDARLPNPIAWLNPSGDVHTLGVCGCRVEPSESGEVLKVFDVRAAVQAWADGQPNFGWAVRSSSTNTVTFWSDDAALATNRPKLIVTYRPPSAGPLAGDHAPQANAGADQTVATNSTVLLNATGSHHPLGGFFVFAWFQTAGPTVVLSDPTSPLPTFTAPTSPGEIVFSVAAFTDSTHFTIDDVRITVQAQPGGTLYASPVANAGPDQTAGEISTVTIPAIVAAANGGSLAIRWTKLSGPPITLMNGQTPSPSFLSPAVGPNGAVIVLDLEVNETIGTFTSVRHDIVQITVIDTPNQAPVPNPGQNRTIETGQWTVLDGSASIEPEGQPMTYTWTQIAGPSINLNQYVVQGAAGAQTFPVFIPNLGAAPGSITAYTFRLTCSDGEMSAATNVTVSAVQPPASFTGSLTVNPMGAYRDEMTVTEAQHLLRRIGLGWHPDDVAQVRAQGLTASLNAQFALPTATPAAVRDEALHYAEDIANPVNSDPQPLQAYDPYPPFVVAQVEAFWNVHFFRAAHTIRERMILFWHDRLAASGRNLSTGKQHWSLSHRDMFEARALGQYRDLLLDFARDPLVLAFIDGFDNLASSPNENFAREFMELHTLGLNDEFGAPIFDDVDVIEGARSFTGWRPSCYSANPALQYSCYPSFVPFFHDQGQKTVLEFTGNFDDEDMVDNALLHDGGDDAARFLASGLLRWFVTAEPPAATVQALRDVILSANWNIQSIVSTLLRSRAMFAPEARKAIVKSPADLANGLVRTLRIPLQTRDIAQTGTSGMLGQLRLLNHRISNPDEVDGWPEDLDWMDEFSAARRSELIRRLLQLAAAPTAPIYGQPGGDYPGIASTPVTLGYLLPPTKAKFAAETVERFCTLLDIDLQKTPAPGFAKSEFQLAVDYLNTQATGGAGGTAYTANPVTFNADLAGSEPKLWGLLMLLLEHADQNRF